MSFKEKYLKYKNKYKNASSIKTYKGMTGGDGDVKEHIQKFLIQVNLMNASLKEAADNPDENKGKNMYARQVNKMLDAYEKIVKSGRNLIVISTIPIKYINLFAWAMEEYSKDSEYVKLLNLYNHLSQVVKTM